MRALAAMAILALSAASGCVVKTAPAAGYQPPPDIGEQSAWLGVLDTRDTSTNVGTLQPFMFDMPNGSGGTTTYGGVRAAMVFTGDLDGDDLSRALSEALKVRSGFAQDLSKMAGDDIRSLSGQQALAASYPENPRLVSVELTDARVDLQRWQPKIIGIAITTSATLGVAYPFLIPWERSNLGLPAAATATVRVFDLATNRFVLAEEIYVEDLVTVRGIPWGRRGYQTAVDAAEERMATRLAEAIVETLQQP